MEGKKSLVGRLFKKENAKEKTEKAGKTRETEEKEEKSVQEESVDSSGNKDKSRPEGSSSIEPDIAKKTHVWKKRNFRIHPSLWEKLERMSFWTRKSKQDIINKALAEYFKTQPRSVFRRIPELDEDDFDFES